MRIMTISLLSVGALMFAGSTNAVELSVEHGSGIKMPAEKELNISFFYDNLAPHGNWIKHAEFGWVFQPKVVVQTKTWKPYFNDGHWVWTDLGWYWQSDLPFAWATFHYGRWHFDKEHTWVWVPDVVWAPAWVVWRESPKFYGWAPMPVGVTIADGGFTFNGRRVEANFDFGLQADYFAFVPADRFLSANLSTVAVAPDKAFAETRAVNNAYKFENNVVINNGIPVQQVAQTTKQEIKPLKVAEAKAAAGEEVRPGEVKNNQITAFRPALKKDAPKAPSKDASSQRSMKTDPTPTETSADKTTEPQDAKTEPKTDTDKRSMSPDDLKVDEGTPTTHQPAKAEEAPGMPKRDLLRERLDAPRDPMKDQRKLDIPQEEREKIADEKGVESQSAAKLENNESVTKPDAAKRDAADTMKKNEPAARDLPVKANDKAFDANKGADLKHETQGHAKAPEAKKDAASLPQSPKETSDQGKGTGPLLNDNDKK